MAPEVRLVALRRRPHHARSATGGHLSPFIGPASTVGVALVLEGIRTEDVVRLVKRKLGSARVGAKGQSVPSGSCHDEQVQGTPVPQMAPQQQHQTRELVSVRDDEVLQGLILGP